MSIVFVVFLIMGVLVGFFAWAGKQAKTKHAKFNKSDVISALKNLISDDAINHDEFDMFISWPIDDPYLESIRSRVIEITTKNAPTANGDISLETVKEIEGLINEAQSHA